MSSGSAQRNVNSTRRSSSVAAPVLGLPAAGQSLPPAVTET